MSGTPAKHLMHTGGDYLRSMAAHYLYRFRLWRSVPFDRSRDLIDTPPEPVAELAPERGVNPSELVMPEHMRLPGPSLRSWAPLIIAKRHEVLAHRKGLLTDGEGRLFADQGTNRSLAWDWRLRRLGLATPSANRMAVERAFWVGHAHQDNYYHWLMDVLAPLALARDWLKQNGLPVVVSAPHQFQRESLEQLFPELELVPWPGQGVLSIRDCYYVPLTRDSSIPEPRLAAALRGIAPLVTKREADSPSQAIWIDRKAGRRALYPVSQDLLSRIERLGYKRIEPEHLSFSAQCRMFAATRVVAGAHGAALVNSLWMPHGGCVIELTSALYGLGCFALLAREAGLDYKVVVKDQRWRLLTSFDFGCHLPLRLSVRDERRLLEVLRAALDP